VTTLPAVRRDNIFTLTVSAPPRTAHISGRNRHRVIETGDVPELPEVESARATIERAALHRTIVDVDDRDTWVCRPHAPGEIRAALAGRTLTAACRRGKALWCETSESPYGSGPVLGLHLGMSGRILVTDQAGALTDGGDRVAGGTGGAAEQADRRPEWSRFTITFDDGGTLRLFDKRRLGRVRLDPDLADLGPDATRIGLAAFRERVGRGTAPVKARLLDQSVLAGVGNLLADETLWQARLDPRRRVDSLGDNDLTMLHRALRSATRSAIRNGGVHTGAVIPHRRPGGHCPRCGAAMERATVGGRTTWFCPREQI
jgi:formamidopyrimidine-DNA glycosylase